MLIKRVVAGVALLGSAGLLSLVRQDIPDEELIPKYAAEPSKLIDIDGIRGRHSQIDNMVCSSALFLAPVN